jgi:hypothetical protein
VAACLGVGLIPRAAAANPAALVVAKKNKGITPTIAAEQRKPVQERARDMRVSGDAAGAGRFLADEAVRLKDPVLFVDSADAFKTAAEESRDIGMVETAIEQANVANDMLLFLGDDRAAKSWQPVASDHRQSLVSRVDDLLSECTALIAEIEAEQAEPEPEPEPEEPERGLKPGMGMIIGGSAAVAIGVAGLGAGVAGIAIGASAQSNVNDPTVYGKEFDEYEAKGKRGNILAFVGLPLAAVGIGAGAALLVLGLKKKRAAGEPEEESVVRSLRVAPALGRYGGLVMSGRF